MLFQQMYKIERLSSVHAIERKSILSYLRFIHQNRLLSKFAMGITPSNSTFAFAWKLLGLCFFRRDVVLLVVFLSALESWTHYPGLRIVSVSAAEGIIWKKVYGSSAVFAIQGMREYMEDR